jgi:FAD/FMN-containing dehydrogenase
MVLLPQVLLSNGTLVTASADENDDLLWAIKGGGPFYGLVLEWTLKVSKAPAVVTTLTYSWDNADAGTAAKVRRRLGRLARLVAATRVHK